METGVARQEHAVGSALWLPLFDELSDRAAVARLAAEAEELDEYSAAGARP